VTAQLIDASNGFHIWSETYDRDMKEVFALQDEIAREIVEKLKLELGYQTSVAQRPENIEAYKLYLQGNFHFYKNDGANLRRALELYQRALAIDSTYARAWAAISYTWGYLADNWAAPGDAYPKAREAALKALALDSTSADAHIAMAGLAGWYEWNDAKADAHARRAVALDPKSAEVLLMLSQVLTDTIAAASAIGKAYEIDPLNPNVAASYVTKLRRDGRMDLALQAAQALVDADPTRAGSVTVLANTLRRAGRADEALQQYRRAMEMSDTLPALTTGYAVALNDRGDVAELRRMRDRLVQSSRTRYVREDVVVLYSMFIGDYDHAFEWVDRAITSHGAAAVALKRNPIYKPLYPDPRWAKAMRRMQST
jgi:adenylate cyclase